MVRRGTPARERQALLSMRAALVLLMAALTGVAAAGLTLLANRHPAEAALTGLAAAGVGAKFFHWLIA